MNTTGQLSAARIMRMNPNAVIRCNHIEVIRMTPAALCRRFGAGHAYVDDDRRSSFV